MWSRSKPLFAVVFLIGTIPVAADLVGLHCPCHSTTDEREQARLSHADNLFAGPPFDLCISNSLMSNHTLNACVMPSATFLTFC